MTQDDLKEIQAQLSWMRPVVQSLEGLARKEERDGVIRSIEAAGYVVKETKGARQSGTVWAGLSGAAAAVYAAWDLLPGAVTTGEWDTFGAAAGAAVTAVVAVWRRYKVGDLRVTK